MGYVRSLPPWKRPPVPPHPDQGRTIREARLSEGWGQRKLAQAASISQPYLCRLETGERALSPRTARRLGEILGVTVPLPLVDVSQTANGRRQAEHRAREERAQRARQAAIPKLAAYWPAHLERWG